MKRTILLVTLVFLSAPALVSSISRAEEGYGKEAQGKSAFVHHTLNVELDPETHSIMAVDRIRLREGFSGRVEFSLRDTLTLLSATAIMPEAPAFEDLDVKRLDETFEDKDYLPKYEVEVPQGTSELLISYTGKIYDPVKEETTLAHVRGGSTSGIIAPEGIYLDPGSGWYPLEENALATYKMLVKVKKPVIIVAQGDLLDRNAIGETQYSLWQSDVPQDGFTLVGNEFVVSTRDVNGVSVSTYFFKEDQALSEKFLDATEKYLNFYTDLLGDFPYNRFDIVENFFQTGYGMPGYTLLGDQVIKMSARGGYDVTGPSGIGHELMHNWWGNYVFFDADEGNWCEALTTYLTNYYWLESHGQEEEALKWRKHASVKYSINAPPDKAYPLIQFKGKQNEVDGAVGYEKGAMFFHYLRTLVGDDAFFAGLRQVIRERGADFATWDDFKDAFKANAPAEPPVNVNLDEVFDQWLNRNDAPQFRIASASSQFDEKSGRYDFNVRFTQSQPFWQLKLRFIVVDENEKQLVEGVLGMVNDDAGFSVSGPKAYPDATVVLDPEWNVFRRIPLDAQEPALNLVVNDVSTIVVYPSAKDEMSDALAKLVETIKASGRQLTVISDSEFKPEMLSGHSLFILGGEGANSAWDTVSSLVPVTTFTANRSAFTLQRRVYDAPEMSILATFAHPNEPGKFISVYHGNSADALSRARYIFYYGWDSFVVFESGRPIERGMLPPLVNPWRQEVKSSRLKVQSTIQ